MTSQDDHFGAIQGTLLYLRSNCMPIDCGIIPYHVVE